MPKSITSDWQSSIDWHNHANACRDDSYNYKNRERRKTIEVFNSVDARPYPDTTVYPLWWYPTAQPKQTVEIRVLGHRFRDIKTGSSNCVPSGVDNIRTTHKWTIHTSKFGSKPDFDLDWQTPLRLKIKENAVNIGESLLEYRQTVDLFSNLAKVLGKAYADLRKGNVKGLSSLLSLDTVASGHLAVQYGVKPLISDITKSIEKLNDKLEGGVFQRVTGRKSKRTYFTHGAPYYRDGYWERSYRPVAYVQLVPFPSNFTLGNIPEQAWNLITFSFIVDWLIPIGPYLSSLDALKDVEHLRGTLTEKQEYFHVEDWSLKHPTFTTEIIPSISYRYHKRTTLETIPLNLPSWEPSLSWTKALNAAAILVGFT